MRRRSWSAQRLVVEYRERHGLRACCGILSNHESPLRGPEFVTRKITLAAAEIAAGRRESLRLGNLDVRRDWGFAGEYVDAMRRMVRSAEPVDLEIGTGIAHELTTVVETAFSAAAIDDPWSYVAQDPTLLRPQDTPTVLIDPVLPSNIWAGRQRSGCLSSSPRWSASTSARSHRRRGTQRLPQSGPMRLMV